MKFDNAQQKKIVNLIHVFNVSDIVYVIVRGHHHLPEQTPGGDIDFIIHEDDFIDAINIAKKEGYHPKQKGRIEVLVELGREAINNPWSAAYLIINSPIQVFRFVSKKLANKKTIKNKKHVKDWRGYNNNIMVHFRNHLVYKSPLSSGEYQIDPTVERELFENRHKHNGLYVPSPSDEVAHLICRGVYDKKGNFPDYYVERIDYLFRNMDEKETKRLNKLLGLIFFDAHELVYNKIRNKQYDNLLESLISYSDY